MSQQMLKAAAPVLKRMPLPVSLFAGQVCVILQTALFFPDQSFLTASSLAGTVYSRGVASKTTRRQCQGRGCQCIHDCCPRRRASASDSAKGEILSRSFSAGYVRRFFLLSNFEKLLQSFNLHIGADLKIPTVDKRKTHTAEIQPKLSATERAAASDPFAGLPLKAWADKLGDRVAPAFQAVQKEQRRSNLAAAKLNRLNQPLAVPQVPHLFPITRW